MMFIEEAQWAIGDLAKIRDGVGTGSTAVITAVHDKHCTAVLLDSQHHLACGEVWPFFDQLQRLNTSWRLGHDVTLCNMKSAKLQHLNGQDGCIVQHPRQGHPVFVQKPKLNEVRLCLTVKLHSGGEHVIDVKNIA